MTGAPILMKKGHGLLVTLCGKVIWRSFTTSWSLTWTQWPADSAWWGECHMISGGQSCDFICVYIRVCTTTESQMAVSSLNFWIWWPMFLTNSSGFVLSWPLTQSSPEVRVHTVHPLSLSFFQSSVQCWPASDYESVITELSPIT